MPEKLVDCTWDQKINIQQAKKNMDDQKIRRTTLFGQKINIRKKDFMPSTGLGNTLQ